MEFQPFYPGVGDVPEDQKDNYKDDGTGRQVLKVVAKDGWALENVKGLSSALGSERETVRRVKAELTRLGLVGANPVTALQGIQELPDPNAEPPEPGKGNKKWEERETELGQKHQRVLDERDVKYKALEGQLHTALATDGARAALVAANVRSVDVLLPHVLRGVRMTDGENGKKQLDVVGPDGSKRWRDAENAFTIKDRVTEMKTEDAYKDQFLTDDVSGGGTRPGGAPRSGEPDLTETGAGVFIGDPDKILPKDRLRTGMI